ncbi:MAG: sulfotransferase [Deltaproteobacteria bacterium]|nr:sulfotransferase [Deltaproteobacteria bacterium]
MSGTRQTSTDYTRPYRPLPVALLNRCGRILERFGLELSDLSEASLVAAARKVTGLRDLGGEGFFARLSLLLQSVHDEARLHPLGRIMVRQNLIRILANRLRLLATLDRHPEIDALAVDAPIFVVGLQRTGTTVMNRLLAADPAHRFLASWQAISPAPIQTDGQGDLGEARRKRLAEISQRGLAYLAPDFFAIHPVEALGPEEDCLLFDYGLWGTVPEATLHVPSFSAWLEQQDHREAYRFYARVLRVLQFQWPGGRWVLKTPQHMEQLEVLLETFPDARIVQTHRDPLRVLASFCSMMAHARGVFSDAVDPQEVARHWFGKARRMVERAMAARERCGPERFCDVLYYDLVRDPGAELRRVYAFLGAEISPQAQAAMRRWTERNPQHKHGRHHYRLDDFGLDRDEVEAAFADYRARFAIPHE